MLAVEVTFLTGRYVATSFDDRMRAEWPPHPARLFSALAAAHFEAPEPAATERSVLEWLEAQGAQAIRASDASARDVMTVFVPVNDSTGVGSLDDEDAAVAEARAAVAGAVGKERATAEKRLAKAEARLAAAVTKAIAPVAAGKEGKDAPGLAASLLPDRRKRQPRTFPSVTPDSPRVVFSWPAAAATPEQHQLLDALASRVVRLGHSSSLVSVRVANDAAEPRWIPDEVGEIRDNDDARTLRVVGPGQLAALDEAFALHADTPGRVLPATFQRYVTPERAVASPPKSVFAEDWIVLRRTAGPHLPSVRAVDLARLLRKAMLSAWGEGAPEILSGHGAPGSPSTRPHLVYLPLPFVGTAHANGDVLGLALVLPRGATSEERRAVARAVERLRKRGDDDSFVIELHLGAAGVLELTVTDGQARPASPLNPRAWCAPARVWASATPVALDRNPGDLRSKDASKEPEAYEEAAKIVAAACEHIGLPRPSQVTVVPAAPLVGAEKARAFPAFLSGRPPIQRVLVHAVLSFPEPVRGPLLLGAGRYLGLGLFRPLGADGD